MPRRPPNEKSREGKTFNYRKPREKNGEITVLADVARQNKIRPNSVFENYESKNKKKKSKKKKSKSKPKTTQSISTSVSSKY